MSEQYVIEIHRNHSEDHFRYSWYVLDAEKADSIERWDSTPDRRFYKHGNQPFADFEARGFTNYRWTAVRQARRSIRTILKYEEETPEGSLVHTELYPKQPCP